MNDNIELTVDEVEILLAFIRNHEREDIPDDVWDLSVKMWEKLYE